MADSIVNGATHFFSNTDFFNGILYIMNQIIVATKSVSWNFCKDSYDKDCIVKVKVKKIISKETAALKILTSDDEEILLNYTAYMGNLIEKLEKSKNVRLFYRNKDSLRKKDIY